MSRICCNRIINMNSVILLTVVFGCAAASPTGKAQNEKIVGGVPVSIDKYPFQVSMRYYGYHICGGSIISSSWVLSASHCVYKRPANTISFRAGSNSSISGGFTTETQTITMHPYYNPATFDYDFALAKVFTSFPLGQSGINYIRVSMIPPSPGTVTSVSGWGTTSSGGTVSTDLLATDVVVVSTSSCNITYPGEISLQMICAAASGKDSCQGDSGGPLVSKSTNQLVGVVSWGTGCADPRYPGVYSNVPTVRLWIRKVSGV